jgi:TIR domain
MNLEGLIRLRPPAHGGPYLGLRAFTADKADRFEGRDDLVDYLLARLARDRLLALVGPSGCGKSSLIEAGVIPRLSEIPGDGTASGWKVVRIRNGMLGITELAGRLSKAFPVQLESYESFENAEALLAKFLSEEPDGQGLCKFLNHIPANERANLLIVVDPFDELVRPAQANVPSQATAFIRLLQAATGPAGPPTAHVVVAMCPESLIEAHVIPEVAAMFNAGMCLIPSLTPAAMRQAIEAPARLEGGEVDTLLVEQLLADIGDRPGRLPLLQHVLMIMWNQAEDDRAPPDAAGCRPPIRLTLDHYKAVGGLDCLARAGEGGFTALADAEQRRIAETMFRLLCDRRDITLVARRPAKVWEVAARANVPVERVKPVVDIFRHRDRAVLVSLDETTELTPQMDLELSHECLIHHWKRLDQWQGQARRFDVFLCHNSQDKPAVRELGKRLRTKGLLPWLDEWELRPGLPWQNLLEEQIEDILTAAVFVGASGFGPWQALEQRAFLQEFVERNCPVIPVILPGCDRVPRLPLFLKGMTWVDFRRPDDEALKSLIWGITGRSVEDQELSKESPGDRKG